MDISNVASKRLNVLVLDGGGVRGLSSLLILRALMAQVNANIDSQRDELQPHDVFQLVAGTSTGGLIALMLGKMGLTVDECINQYETLSKDIFGRKHLRGRMTRGLAPAKYSGKRLETCIQKLLQARRLDKHLSMRHTTDRMACAVICREHSSASQYSKLKKIAIPICSLPCKDNFDCTVCEAARATSAAPTFFPVMKIGDRFFADGGLKHNNPSFAMYYHYTSGARKEAARKSHFGRHTAPPFSPHGTLDCAQVRFTNIGTGAKIDEVEPGKREWLASLIPGPIRKGVFLKQTLAEIAVDAEEKADIMRTFQELNPHTFKYERFDANHGVSNIKLDNYRGLGDIRTKTQLYLEEQETIDMLEEVGRDIATDYRIRRLTNDQSTLPTDPISDTSLCPPTLTHTAALSTSSGPSSNSNYPESESRDSGNHDGLEHGEPSLVDIPVTAAPISSNEHQKPKETVIGTASRNGLRAYPALQVASA